MKIFAIATFAFTAMVCAEKPVTPASSAPYPPSGYKPNGPLFLLPIKKAPDAPPSPTYGAPVYPFVPITSSTTEKSAEPTTTAKTEQETETAAPSDSAAKSQKQEVIDTGVYYILTPEGKLQKVEYFTAPQPQSEIAQKLQEYNVNGEKAQQFRFNGVVSNFQYKDVEPVSAPIYSYNNVPGPLVRILRKSENN